MSDQTTFTITVTMGDRWIPQFRGLLDFMEWSGRVGASRKISFYSDGDGDFHPRFEWSIEGESASPIEPDSDEPYWDAG